MLERTVKTAPALPAEKTSPRGVYDRYHIDTQPAPDLTQWPSRFTVKVQRSGLAKLLIKELFHYRGRKDVILSRPCLYGVFSGPVGGFAPREHLCVGCLRCTTEFPEFVQVEHNPARQRLGDDYFTFGYVDALTYEAQTGAIPVKGAGYRGKFGGQGWDGMWTDMSEIVRPTRDGIHGREHISTVVDIGYKPNALSFDEQGKLLGTAPSTFSLPLSLMFDAPPPNSAEDTVSTISSQTAVEISTLSILPLGQIIKLGLTGDHIVPLVKPDEVENLRLLGFALRLIEMDGWDQTLYDEIRAQFPESQIALRLPFTEDDAVLGYVDAGIHIFHFLADYHGKNEDDAFVLDLIRATHKTFVDAGIRQEVTLLGSGGMIAAEHVPKAIICGLDAVALDTPLLVALQAEFQGQCADRQTSHFEMPKRLNVEWGVRRLKNMSATWRDQLLEILGAMGLREVRRLRGEVGRAMFMHDIEKEAFIDVEGYRG
ncbi:MAG: hypothetical protein DWQ07_13435 [Chloroflexi bacterium]|nr:MAG: hypothetical protein DWQ07_13435 [Chloroflexota bacterium]MBL1196761.1 hypothetical protein [Chloroflexota bacterium]NOH14055.1 hypothetical protein [Chloroflexota bacterium]